jgi:CheY-like chemotaxis protein
MSEIVVVIAEDDDIQRELLRAILELERLTVHEARNGVEALEAIERFRPDLVITDNFMPTMDGYALIRAVRCLPGDDAALPIVLLSAADRDRRLLAEDPSGRSRYVQKPIDTDDFVAVIRGLLGPLGQSGGGGAPPDRAPGRTA